MIRRLDRGPARELGIRIVLFTLACTFTAACDGGSDTSSADGGSGAATSSGGSGGTGGALTGGTGGAGGAATGATGGAGGTATGGSGGSAGGEATCLEQRAEALGPIDKISEGEVTVLDEAGGVVFIDASAGGIMAQKDNPWVYVSLGTRARAELTDVTADGSQAWDIALKRPVLRANGGHGGLAGEGAAVHLDKEFDAVTAADAQGVTYPEEDWFDDACALQVDEGGAIATSFAGWYLYENMKVTPAPGTWLVRGGGGASVFKLQILSYYSNPDGSDGMAGGRYLVRVATLVP